MLKPNNPRTETYHVRRFEECPCVGGCSSWSEFLPFPERVYLPRLKSLCLEALQPQSGGGRKEDVEHQEIWIGCFPKSQRAADHAPCASGPYWSNVGKHFHHSFKRAPQDWRMLALTSAEILKRRPAALSTDGEGKRGMAQNLHRVSSTEYGAQAWILHCSGVGKGGG